MGRAGRAVESHTLVREEGSLTVVQTLALPPDHQAPGPALQVMVPGEGKAVSHRPPPCPLAPVQPTVMYSPRLRAGPKAAPVV